MAEFELDVHNAQGADFNHFLQRENGDVPQALRQWSMALIGRAAELVTVANRLEDDLEVSAKAKEHDEDWIPAHERAGYPGDGQPAMGVHSNPARVRIRATEKTKQAIKDLDLLIYHDRV